MRTKKAESTNHQNFRYLSLFLKFNILLAIWVAVGFSALGEGMIHVGDSEAQMLEALGKPQGMAVMNGAVCYVYDGGNIMVKDGTVISVPKDFEAATQRKQVEKEAARLEKIKQREFVAAQKAKGLVFYDGRWMTPEQKARLEANARKVAAERTAQRIAAEAEREEQRMAAEAALRPKLLLLSWRWRIKHGYAIAEGEVQNISDQSLRDIEVVVSFYAADGTFITSDDSLLEFNPVLPGQTSPFRAMVSHTPQMSGARIDFKELRGGSVLWRKKKSD